MYTKTVLESTAKVATLVPQSFVRVMSPKMSELVAGFLRHGQYELTLSPETIRKYDECLRWVIRDLGDLSVGDIRLVHVTELKQKIMMRGAGESRVGSMVFALKSFLRFCKDMLELEVLDPNKIMPPLARRIMSLLSRTKLQTRPWLDLQILLSIGLKRILINAS